MKKYVDGTWRMFNDFYVEEPDNPGGETGGETCGETGGDSSGSQGSGVDNRNIRR